MRFRNAVNHVLIGKIVILAAAMAYSIYFSRVLQAEGQGYLSVIRSIAGIFLQLWNFGLHSAHTYYVTQNRSQLSLAEGNIFISLLLSVGIAAVSYPIMLVFPELLKISPDLLLFALCLFVTNLFLLLQENLFLSIGNLTKYNLLQILPYILATGIAIMWSYWGAVDIYVASIALVIAQLVVILISLMDNMLVKPKMSLKYFLSVMPYGMKSYCSCLITYLLLRADILMLNHFLSKQEVGYYSLAVYITDMLYIFSASVSAVLFPALSSLKTIEQRTKLLKNVIRVAIPASIIIAFAVCVFAGELVHFFFGDGYMESVPLVRILTVASISWGIVSFSFNFFAAENRFIETIIIPLIGLSINILMNYILIPMRQAYGAALASDVSYSFVCVSMYACLYIYICKERKGRENA